MRTVGATLALLCVCAATTAPASRAWASAPATLVSCGGAGYSVEDPITSGFYIPSYPGGSLQSVALRFGGGSEGTGTITLSAHAGAYDGPLIGSSTALVTSPINFVTPITFTFAGNPTVSRGSTVAFIITASGAIASSPILYSVFVGVVTTGNRLSSADLACPIIETEGTLPPLDTIRNQGVEITIIGLRDTVPPDTSITSGPAGLINTRNISFTWTGTDDSTLTANLTYAFRLDPLQPIFSAFTGGTSTTYSDLGDGSYTFLVKARDQEGNEDPTPASRSFTVDATPPDTTINSGPSSFISTNSASFTWTGSDNLTPTGGLLFAFRLDPLEPAFSAFTSATSKTYSDLANGSYTFLVKARDQAGNEDPTPASRSFSVDTTAPDTTITSGPSGFIATSSATFTWTGVNGSTPLLFAFRLDPLEPNFSAPSSATSKTYTGLADGSYTFLVKARDQALNEDPTPASRQFIVDTTPPETTIISGSSGTISTNTATFQWTGSDNFTSPGSLLYAFRLAPLEGTFTCCTAITSRTYSGLIPGDYTFFVKAIDEAGNTDPTPDSRSFTVAGIPPDTIITSGPSGLINTNTASFAWTGTGGTGGLSFAFRLAPLEAEFSVFGSATSKTYTGLPNGSYTFLVKARDEAGLEDPTPATRSFTVDTTAATVTSVTGTVQATFQGVTQTVTPGFLVTQGMELNTGPDGQVQGSCNDGSQFTLAPNSSVFLEDSLCNPVGSGMLDVTQGTFTLISVGASASGSPIRAQNQVAGVRTPVSVGTATSSGADFATTYNQVGSRGTAVTTVQSGTVAVTDAVTGAVSMVAAGQQNTVNEPVPGVVASILPSSRSVQVGNPATVFATIVNAGRSRATVCKPSLVTNVPATFSFQTTDPTSNQVNGTRSTPVSIPAGAGQTFVLAFTPTAPIDPTDLTLSFACGQTQAPVTFGVNTMSLSASAAPIPDIVALAATPDNNGIVNISPSTGFGVFAVATVNVGVTGSITASADTDGASLPVAISLCHTNPATGACVGAPAESVTTTINAGATPTFSIFVIGTGAPVPFDPANNRIFVRFKDAGGVTRGSTSVAVRTQ